MQPDNACRRVLYFQSLAETDAHNSLGWLASVEHIAPSIRKTHNSIDSYFDNLSRELLERLGQKHRINFEDHWQPRSFPVSVRIALFALIFMAGSLSNYFGSKHTVNLWLNPFTGFLVWNLLVYLIIAMRKVFGQKAALPFGLLPKLFLGLLPTIQTLRNKYSWGHLEKADKWGTLSKTQIVFRKKLLKAFPQLYLNRLLTKLHIAAILFALGVVTGLYFRGFAESYQFTWESTFISEEARPFWLNLLFGPVLLLTKPIFPNGLPALATDHGAPWIHLFATATILYIVIPRFCLALLAFLRQKKAAATLAIHWSDPFWQSWYAASDPAKIPLHLLFYSFEPTEKQRDAFSNRLQKILPGKFTKGWQEKFSWGDIETDKLDLDRGGFLVVAFNAAQTPEEEVHGAFTENLIQALLVSSKPHSLLVFLDTSNLSEENQSHRIALWTNLLQSHKVLDICPWSFSESPSQPVPPKIKDAIMRFSA